MEEVARGGNLNDLKYLIEHGIDLDCIARLMASFGRTDILQYLHTQGATFDRVIDYAARDGHLETVKWLRSVGAEWDHWAADCAAKHGHLETLKWIRANGGDWHRAAVFAVEKNQLEVLQWILENEGSFNNTPVIDYAAKRGLTRMVKYLGLCGCAHLTTGEAMKEAMERQDYEMIQCLANIGVRPTVVPDDDNALDFAMRIGIDVPKDCDTIMSETMHTKKMPITGDLIYIIMDYIYFIGTTAAR